ncbi:Geranyl diphosphate diphosphatase protein [Dioscorea alata]|uniref:Geranyl diphosphate diphosphatase protein n=1 Tax=Dioscorea alata TaxID=55571 RepID=A0ACB7VET5_DIOAL|nr:Geranyl diphosphate diphosphatase protein [Dioscorea alata]
MSLIDDLQRLGIAYHFDEEIQALSSQCFNFKSGKDDLFGTSLCFRLLRQQGHNASIDMFLKFKDNNGRFKEELSKDLRGLQSLYEASYMGVEGEELLSEAMEFSKHNLQASMDWLQPSLAKQVGMSLAFPTPRIMEKFEARRYIENWKQDLRKNSEIIELATLDFNSVQSLYQREIIELKRWWRELGLAHKLPFARDRPLECFLWTVGIFPEPNYSECRIEVAKAVAILLVLDDVYDSYGSLDELILFTEAIQRWDIAGIDHLPEYMKICYMALYNSINETSYKVLKNHGWCIIPELTKQWQKICEAFLVEARWFCNNHVPKLDDYLNNGITTAGTYMALVYGFYLIGKQVTKESADLVNDAPKLFYNSGRILRLWDDLGTAKDEQERGDVASSIEICKKENGFISEDDARNGVRGLIDQTWKDLNKELIGLSPLGQSLIKVSLNLARTSQLIYQHGDDEKAPSIEDSIHSLLIEPIHYS